MDNVYIVRMKFNGPLHIGSDIPGIGEETVQEIIHSDTIFSTIINYYTVIRNNKQDVDHLLRNFYHGEIPFRITSGYIYEAPRYGKPRYYLPKPIIDPPDFYCNGYNSYHKVSQIKSVRETKFIRLEILYDWLKNRNVLHSLEDNNKQFSNTHTIEVRPRHARDRINEETMIFHTGLLHLKKASGIYFLIQMNRESTYFNMEILESVLNTIKKVGIGGKIGCGFGQISGFEIIRADADEGWKRILELPRQEYSLLLSLYYPGTSEALMAEDYIAYRLVKRSGWIYSTSVPIQFKRKTCTLLSEGSVVCRSYGGSLIDVTPHGFEVYHRVYRYGIHFGLPISKYWGDCIE